MKSENENISMPDMEEKVITVCYGVKRKWAHRRDAVEFFREGMSVCEGAEKERYETVVSRLLSGKTVCSDK